jgi:4-alpha-glucanotransferase
MKIIHIASEMAPVAKVGGLADVLLGLSRALQSRGHDVSVFIPKYDCMKINEINDLKSVRPVTFIYRGKTETCQVWKGKVLGVTTYFIEPNPPAKFFAQGKFYGCENDTERFTLFSLAAIEFLAQQSQMPDILHLHDWQTAIIAPIFKKFFAKDFPTKIIYTIHNLEYQGKCTVETLDHVGLPSDLTTLLDPHTPNTANLMRAGIEFSDYTNTVSPTYAKEVCSPHGGKGLDQILHDKRPLFSGVLNGLDADYWNPEIDPLLTHHYSPRDLTGKALMKAQIQKRLGLEITNDKPIVASITRLVPQKGMHLIKHALYRTLEQGGQFILLGSCPIPEVQAEFERLALEVKPDPRAFVVLENDEKFAHEVYGAADLLVVPSIFEPCGLTQMVALRYGAIPIVRETGGLADTVFDLDTSEIGLEQRNGFSFKDPDNGGINWALDRAIKLWKSDREKFEQVRHRGMLADTSWKKSAKEYEEIYEKTIGRWGPALEKRLLETASSSQWRNIGIHSHHGIALPISALKSGQSKGIGEYLDLIPLIDWCAEIGLDTIQLLPLNDTGTDTSPYNAISAFALNPILLSIAALPAKSKDATLDSLSDQLTNLNKLPKINFSKVQELKTAYLDHYLDLWQHEILAQESYQTFKSENTWLDPYALFKVLKAKNGGKYWKEWPKEEQSCTKELIKKYQKLTDRHCAIQFLCFEQMKQVKRHATNRKVWIKGDIPILISPDSADAWNLPQLFLTGVGAGAPPDMYSKEGQDWGFPIYNWDVMENEDYRFWRERLRVASECYHIYRIDHIVGFYRIWAVPHGKKPIEGSFIPEDRKKWIPQGEKILRMMISSAAMLPIGEDLGVIPPEVRKNMKELGICGTKVIRWERYYEDDASFIPPRSFIPESMSTVSTHDSEPLMLWWKENKADAELYAREKGWKWTPELTNAAKAEILTESHRSGSLFHINLLSEYLALFPEMVAADPQQERINIPGKILPTNWAYRFVPTVKEIVESEKLQHLMRTCLGNDAKLSPRKKKLDPAKV